MRGTAKLAGYRLALACLLVLTMTPLAVHDRAEAAMEGSWALSFNMKGMNGCRDCPFNDAVDDALISSLSNRSPMPSVIMTQEMCTAHSNKLQAFLQPRGYTRASTLPLYIGGSCGYFGSAIWVKGSSTWALRIEHEEQRGTACGGSDMYYIKVLACSNHFDNDNVTLALSQLDRVHWWVDHDTRLPGHFKVLGGDFNMNTKSLNYWRGHEVMVYPRNYREADTPAQPLPLSTRGTTDGGSKYDYMWHQSEISPTRARVNSSPHSDHHIYESFL